MNFDRPLNALVYSLAMVKMVRYLNAYYRHIEDHYQASYSKASMDLVIENFFTKIENQSTMSHDDHGSLDNAAILLQGLCVCMVNFEPFK